MLFRSPCKPESGTKINIQISGADMSASSGVFSETVGGAVEEEEESGGGGILGGLMGGGDEKPAASKKAKAPAKKAPAKKAPAKKAPARKGKFTLEGARVTTGDDVAWALVGFILVALLILI